VDEGNIMQCPYRNIGKESGCDLVDDLDGISGVVAREFCDYRHCQECPLFQEALQENLKEWTSQPIESTSKQQPAETVASPVPGFWKLALEHRRHEA
jgi:hypothetical protein